MERYAFMEEFCYFRYLVQTYICNFIQNKDLHDI